MNRRLQPTLEVDGVQITHPDKFWWEHERISKLDVANYYSSVAPRMLPWLDHRLLTVERCPDGIEGPCFFEKDFSKGVPFGLPTCVVPTQDARKPVRYAVGGSRRTLLTLVNLGCISFHIMNCNADSRDHPDWLAFDLDPSTGLFSDAAKASIVLRGILDEMNLRSFPKTTGGRGLHVLVPLLRKSGMDQEMVRNFGRQVCEKLAKEAPSIVTVEMRKAKRGDRVFADWLRNAFGQTIAAPYSIRCRPGAPVCVPLNWDEVNLNLNPLEFNIRTMPSRLNTSDSWAGFWDCRQNLAKVMKACVA